jgi:hypothetical protein
MLSSSRRALAEVHTLKQKSGLHLERAPGHNVVGTVIPLNSAMFWNVRAMPWRRASWGRIWVRVVPL